MLHAHISRSARDCDGQLDNEWVVSMNEEEVEESKQEVNDFSDIHFTERVVISISSLWSAEDAVIKIKQVDGQPFITYDEKTDEGGVSTEARFCTDEDCDPNEKSHRDHFAEAMGY